VGVADIFVSYTSKDRDWAFWIGQELLKLGHAPHIHEWETAAGGDISRWMEERHDAADHILCVVSEAYLRAPYSSWERRAAQWVATTNRRTVANNTAVVLEALERHNEAQALCEKYGLGDQNKIATPHGNLSNPSASPLNQAASAPFGSNGRNVPRNPAAPRRE
jgi:TIR domain